MNSILVTGGAGFIGSTFVKTLIDNGYKNITVVDKLTECSNIKNVPKGVNFIHSCYSDIRPILLKDLGIDTIFNFGAETHVDKSIKNPALFFENNVIKLNLFLRHIQLSGLNPLFVQISTDEVYGDRQTESGFKETDYLQPNNPYSASKAGSEHLVTAYANTFNLRYKITRCTNNYGENQYYEKLIPRTVHRLKNNLKAEIHGNGSNTRDWLHVQDHCNAILKFTISDIDSPIINISSNDEYQNIDIVRMICDILKVNFEENTEFVDNRLGNDKRYFVNSELLRNLLSWHPNHSIKNDLVKIIDI